MTQVMTSWEAETCKKWQKIWEFGCVWTALGCIDPNNKNIFVARREDSLEQYT